MNSFVVRGSPDPARVSDRRSPSFGVCSASNNASKARADGERGRPSVRHSGGVVRPAPNTSPRRAHHKNKQRPDTELEASGFEGEPSRLRPEGAATNQPRASPWDYDVKCASSPERAAQWYGVVSPFQGSRINVQTDPGAMPRADLFGPFRTKSEVRESWLHFHQ